MPKRFQKKQGEIIIAKLKEQGLLDTTKKLDSDNNFLYLPITKETSLGEVVKREAPEKIAKPRSIQDILKNKLSPEEMDAVGTSFDLIGNVAVVEIPEGFRAKREGNRQGFDRIISLPNNSIEKDQRSLRGL